MEKSFPIPCSPCSNIQINVWGPFCFEPGTSAFRKTFYFRKMIEKKINYILCFCISLVVVSFTPFGNKSESREVSSRCKQRVLCLPYHIIKSILVAISQLFLAVLSVVLSFPNHNKVQLVLVVTISSSIFQMGNVWHVLQHRSSVR